MSPNKSTRRPVVNPEPIARIGQAERTRAAILDAAFEFLWSRPFRDMTVNALMEQIPQGRTAFYKYFDDIHGVMAALLKNLESEILEGAGTWLSDDGDPVALLYESLAAEVQIGYRYGPFIKAVSDAAGTNAELEDEWNWLLDRFDEAVSDAAMYIRKFGHRPRSRPQPVQDAITRVWISTLYGQQWATGHTSTLYRKQVPDPPEPR
jgi:AcrR family transcriptional regulator